MWKNKGLSLEDIGQELPRLREKLEKAFPAYITSLERVSEMPVEFGRRWRASWVEGHLEKVRQSYQQYYSQGMAGALFGGMVSNLMSTITRQPTPAPSPANSLSFAIAVLPSGETKPTLIGMYPQPAGVITISLEQFERAALKLRGQVLSGELVPENEAEVPRLIYNSLAKTKS